MDTEEAAEAVIAEAVIVAEDFADLMEEDIMGITITGIMGITAITGTDAALSIF